MKRLHVHVSVDDLARSVRFYSTLFSAEPTVLEPDYAKWMLEDPRVNFAIGTGSGEAGISKQWIADPQGVPWETFFTHGTATVYGQSGGLTKLGEASGGLSTCGCAPAALTRPAAERASTEARCAPSCCA